METTNHTNFTVTEPTPDQFQKIKADLQFISQFTKIAKTFGSRVIIHGGYSVDGAIGKITRPHNDIDIQIYSQDDNGVEILKNILKGVSTNSADTEIELKHTDLYYLNYYIKMPGFRGDIYYIHVADNPFDDTKTIIKTDGSRNESQEYETHMVKLDSIEFEATLPLKELEDKITKRDRGEKQRDEIDQDISNLQHLLSNI